MLSGAFGCWNNYGGNRFQGNLRPRPGKWRLAEEVPVTLLGDVVVSFILKIDHDVHHVMQRVLHCRYTLTRDFLAELRLHVDLEKEDRVGTQN